jgi:hypothetical protein
MKFGGDTDSSADVMIVMSKYGPAHALKQHGGGYVVCTRRASLCKFCAEQGVPVYPPDPIDAMIKALVDNWGKRWAESHRHQAEVADNEVWPAKGLHIIAIDDDTKERTVLVSFGENDSASKAVSALVHVHNQMVGRPE